VVVLFSEASKGVDHWVGELRKLLPGDSEVRICEATRMLVAYARHLRITGDVLSGRKPDAVDVAAYLAKLREADTLVREAAGRVKDPARRERIEGRLKLLEELRSLAAPAHQ